MGSRVWFWVVGSASALSGCGASQATQHGETVPDAVSSTALPAAPLPPSAVVHIAAVDAPAPANPDASADAARVVIYDHGSGRSAASFPEATAASPPTNPPSSSATPPPAPPSSAAPAPATSAAKPPGGGVSNAVHVVAAMRLDFRACYQAGLAEDRSLAGSIRVTIRVGADGSVTHADGAPSGRLSQSVVDCVLGRVYRAKFDPPEGGSAVIALPVTFMKAD